MEQIARAEMHQPTQSNMRDLPAGATRKFWSWACDEGSGTRTLYLDGVIAEESWFDDDVTPKAFKAELYGGEGDIVIWLNSPGGDCIAASQIYAMLMDYRGDVTVKIDGIAASAASVIAMAGTKVLMAPTALMMVHNPLTVAIGDSGEMQKAIAMLGEVKESIINAYEIKTGLSRVRLSHLMDAETWLNANKAIEMGFADGILEDTKRGHPEAITFAFSRRAVTNSLMSKLIPKPESKVNTGISIEAAMQNLQARKYI
jgi:ATP-dependent Clp protease protease subunit